MEIKLKPISSDSITKSISNDFVMLEISGSIDRTNNVLVKAKALLQSVNADSMVKSFDSALIQETFLQNKTKAK